jgi:uncharacterized protein YidB (DUF937 family)
MGIFDQLKGPVLQEVMGLINNQEGGLSGLVGKLKDSGLADQVNSWIGTGSNKSVDASQLSSALGSDVVSKIAGKLGISTEEAAGSMAGALPEVIDKLTPNGKIETDDIVQQGLSALKGLFG